MMNHSTYPNSKQSLYIIILFSGSFALYFFLTGTVPQLLGFQLSSLYRAIVFSLASPIATLPLILYISNKSGTQVRWSVNLPEARIILVLALLALVSIILTSPLSNPKEYYINLVEAKLKFLSFIKTDFDLNTVIKIIGAVLFAPIFEEVLFRKQIFGLLLKKYSPVWSIVLSSVLFAFGHMRFSDIGTLFIWGILLGIVYYKTSSIEASILLHSFIGILTFFIKKEFHDITALLLFKYVSMMVVCFVVMFLIIKYLTHYGKTKKFNGTEVSDGSFPAYR